MFEQLTFTNEKEKQELDTFDLLDKGLQENKKPFIEEQLDATIKSLFTMQKVKTNISLEMVKQLVSEDVYNQLETTLYQKTMESVPYDKETGFTREEYNALIDKMVQDKMFNIAMDDNGNLTVVNHPWNSTEFKETIYIDCIDCDKFLPLAKAAMENHLERHNAYSEAHNLNGEDISASLTAALVVVSNVLARAQALNRAGNDVLDKQDFSQPTNQEEFEKFEKNINENEKNNKDLWDKNINEIIPDDNDEPPAGGGASGFASIGESR